MTNRCRSDPVEPGSGGTVAQRPLRDHLLEQLCRVGRVTATAAATHRVEPDEWIPPDERVELEAALGRSIDEPLELRSTSCNHSTPRNVARDLRSACCCTRARHRQRECC
jgi:hypothetical protein